MDVAEQVKPERSLEEYLVHIVNTKAAIKIEVTKQSILGAAFLFAIVGLFTNTTVVLVLAILIAMTLLYSASKLAEFIHRRSDLTAGLVVSWVARPAEGLEAWRAEAARRLLSLYAVGRLRRIKDAEALQSGLDRRFVRRGNLDYLLSVEEILCRLGSFSSSELEQLFERGLQIRSIEELDTCLGFVQEMFSNYHCSPKDADEMLGCMHRISTCDVLHEYHQRRAECEEGKG